MTLISSKPALASFDLAEKMAWYGVGELFRKSTKSFAWPGLREAILDNERGAAILRGHNEIN